MSAGEVADAAGAVDELQDAAASLARAIDHESRVEGAIASRELPAIRPDESTRTETEILRDHPEWQWLTGSDPRPPTDDEQAAYAKRRTDGAYDIYGITETTAAQEGAAAVSAPSAPASSGGAGAEGAA